MIAATGARWPIGREDTATFGPDSPEEDAVRDLSFHFGLRRLGFGVTLSFHKASYLDYSEEPNV